MQKYMSMTDEQLEQARVNATTFNTMACVAKELGRRSRLRLNETRTLTRALIDATESGPDMINNPGYWVSVRFDNNSYKNYTYKSVEPVKVGDRVFVMSPYSGLTVVTVVADSKPIGAHEKTFKYKWTLKYRDDPEYLRRTEQDKNDQAEQRIVELRESIAKLEAEIALLEF